MAEADKDKTAGRALAEPAPHLAALSEKARDYARNARSENTQRAYDADW
ncbi:MAG: integrase, partial [Hyphomicrobiales bacterium]